MAYYAYATPSCEEDAEQHDLTERLEELQRKLEESQMLQSLDRFSKPFLKKRVENKRFIIEERFMGQDTMLCFLRVMKRGSGEYERFVKQTKSGETETFLRRHSPRDEELKDYLAERKKTQPTEPLPSLSDVESAYLQSLNSSPQREEGIILESREWVERMKKEDEGARLRYGEVVEQIASGADPEQAVAVHPDRRKYRVLYRYFPSLRKWFLVAPVGPSEPDDERELQDVFREDYGKLFENGQDVEEKYLLRMSQRSYPAVITLDEDMWRSTQESEEANLSLSPEEVKILDSVLESSREDAEERSGAYPLFINGRPGSGKSTVLQYLFTEHLYFHLQQLRRADDPHLSHPPLYLTYSERLLADARGIVEDILRCDSDKRLESGASYLEDPDVQEEIDRSFGYFRNFLHGLLPEDDKKAFDPEKYVGFPRFRRACQKKIDPHPHASVRKLSPELVWHVIRTYIKGMRQEASEYPDPYFYEHELPSSQRSVAKRTFEEVFEKLWEPWYKELCEKEGYWDDQDLARRLLDLDLDFSHYPTVFCDEAQDFTKIELELMFQFSLYARRNVPSFQLKKVPFAFAGDPFQTLNPTGFNWDATQASFHENIVRQLDKTGDADLSFNFRELTFNYRSKRPIVQFCNLIQLLRGRAFGVKNLKPQDTWKLSSAASPPVYFRSDAPSCREALQKQVELVIMVPCREGQEEAFVKGDDFLREVAWDETQEAITRNVFSPVRAKGLQFSRVVLYKFGAQGLEDHGSDLRNLTNGDAGQLTEEEALPLEYFVNRLYVAASRPEKRLLIADTEEALSDFWSFAKDLDPEEMLGGYESRYSWGTEDITKIQDGDADDISGGDRDEPEDLGEKFREEAEAKRDPYLMRLARQNFSAANSPAKAARCEARALEFEDKWVEAGNVYAEELAEAQRALDCFWKAQAYGAILDLGQSSRSIAGQLRHRAADFMEGGQDARSCEQFLGHFYERFEQDEHRAGLLSDEHWMPVLNQVIAALASLASDGDAALTAGDWKRIFAQLRSIRNGGVGFAESLDLARLAYEADAPREAFQIWNRLEKLPTSAPEWMLEVLADAEPYPKNLKWLDHLGRTRDLIESHEAHPDVSLTDRSLRLTVFEAYMHEGALDKALAFLGAEPDEQQLVRLLEAAMERESVSFAHEVAASLLSYYVDAGRWGTAINFAEKAQLGKVRTTAMRSFAWDVTRLNAVLVRKLAVSQTLTDASGSKGVDRVSSYLKQCLLSPERSLRRMVSAAEAGAAIERAYRIVDALEFYEAVIDGKWGSESKIQRLGRERWVRNKFRQAEITSDSRRGQQYEQEAQRKQRAWNVPAIGQMPDYPKIEQPFPAGIEQMLPADQKARTPEAVPAEPAKPEAASTREVEPSTHQIGIGEQVFECEPLREVGRLEILNRATKNRVVLSVQDEVAESLRVQTDREDHADEAPASWLIDEWNMRCTFEPADGHTKVHLEEATSETPLLTVRL